MQHLPPDWAQLATNTDLAARGTELRGEMRAMEGRINKQFGAVAGQFKELRGETTELALPHKTRRAGMASNGGMVCRSAGSGRYWCCGVALFRVEAVSPGVPGRGCTIGGSTRAGAGTSAFSPDGLPQHRVPENGGDEGLALEELHHPFERLWTLLGVVERASSIAHDMAQRPHHGAGLGDQHRAEDVVDTRTRRPLDSSTTATTPW